MVLLGDEAQVEARFSPFGDSANPDARSVHGLRRTYHRLRNRLHAPDELLGDVSHVDSHSVRLEMVFVLVQDRWTVCAECTIGSEIILDAPDGTPR